MLHVVLYGNCQCQGLVFLLRYFYASISVEVEFSHIENYTLIKKSLPIDEQVLQQADIFIYQPIDKVHGPYSTDRTYQGNILSLLSKNCRQISFPYIYNSALWAFIPPADIDSFIGGFGETMRYINKEPLEDLFRSGFTLKQAITRFKRSLTTQIASKNVKIPLKRKNYFAMLRFQIISSLTSAKKDYF
jgi:hypothetical protein